MAPHGKQMTPEEKQIIVALSQQGYSSYKIAEMTGKHRRTISKFLRRHRAVPFFDGRYFDRITRYFFK
jgi:IS30 family transposase